MEFRLGVPAALAVLAAVAVLSVPAARAQNGDLAFAASVRSTGHIYFVMVGPPGAKVVVHELVEGRPQYVLTATLSESGGAVVEKARRWRCDRVVRRFVATLTQPDGSTVTRDFPVRTPSCGDRLELALPRRVRQGQRVRVRVRDRWRIGDVAARLCSGSGRPLTCRPLELRPGRSSVATAVPPPRGRTLVIVLKTPYQRLERHVRIGGGRGPEGPDPVMRARPMVLITGDSLMQSLDQILRDRLADRFRVSVDTNVGTGLSKPGFDWLRHARQTATRLRPAATVMFLGGNEGGSLRTTGGETVGCCGAAWIDAYARRARLVMSAYARRGTASVIWLRLPAPRHPDVAAAWFAINEALERAATGLPTVQTVPLDELLSPGWRYRATIHYRGRRVRVRLSDGGHLSIPGAGIAADVVIRALRRARVF